jgi:hypothetical protein
MKNYTPEIIEHLSNVFDQICEPFDWKSPIDAVFDISSCGFSIEDAIESVVFHTATEPKISQVGLTKYRIRSKGYRLGPAGDY